MQGRLENAIKAESNIDKILLELPECVSEYYLFLCSKREPKTCLEYLRKIRNFVKFIDEDTKNANLKKVKDTDIARYMKFLETTTKNGEVVETSFTYRKANYSILNSFFDFMTKKHYVKENPMLLIERETGKDHPKRKFLKENELRAILESVEYGIGRHRDKSWQARDMAILMLFMQTGMRRTALTEINVEDIDFNTNTLVIIDKGHEYHKYVLSPVLMEHIKKWMTYRERLLEGKQCDALFISANRTRITSAAVFEMVEKYTQDALGYKVSPHKLRAAYCNLLLRETGNLHLVSKLVGHKRVDTTEIYLDDTSEEDKEMAANMITSKLFV